MSTSSTKPMPLAWRATSTARPTRLLAPTAWKFFLGSRAESALHGMIARAFTLAPLDEHQSLALLVACLVFVRDRNEHPPGRCPRGHLRGQVLDQAPELRPPWPAAGPSAR